MSKKYKNISKHSISAIYRGKKVLIKPGEIITGPEELSQYNGLTEVSSPDFYKMENVLMNVLDINKKEVDSMIHKLRDLDTSKPYSDYQKKSEKKTFSIITLTHHKPTYINFLETLRSQETDYTFELIPVFNHQNEFKSCSQALNFGMSLANSDYYIITHQDLLVPKYWIQKFKETFDRLEKQQINVGFIGMAGTIKLSKDPRSDLGVLYLSDEIEIGLGRKRSLADIMRQQYGSHREVQCLDECAIACKSSLGIRYDEETFDHYHFYGGDICLQALSKGYKNFAVDVDCFHLSDGQKNLVNEVHKKHFLEHGNRLFKKWTPKFPYFRTTCASFLGPEKLWHPLIFYGVNKTYGTNYPMEIRVM